MNLFHSDLQPCVGHSNLGLQNTQVGNYAITYSQVKIPEGKIRHSNRYLHTDTEVRVIISKKWNGKPLKYQQQLYGLYNYRNDYIFRKPSYLTAI